MPDRIRPIAVMLRPLIRSFVGSSSFAPKVKEGDYVQKGELLLEFDIEKIKVAGHPITTPVIVTNTDIYEEVLATKGTSVEPGSVLIQCT